MDTIWNMNMYASNTLVSIAWNLRDLLRSIWISTNVYWEECVDNTLFEIFITSLVSMFKKENQLEVQGRGTALSLTDGPSFLFLLDMTPPGIEIIHCVHEKHVIIMTMPLVMS